MRTLAGAVLIAVAEQAFSHAMMINFPNHLFASEILLPASGILLFLGIVMLIWGVLTDFRSSTAPVTSTATGSAEAAS